MEPILQAEGLEKAYGRRGNVTYALKGLSFAMGAGEFVGVMGPSGSGKTTLLNCLATIDRPDQGRIRIGGADVTAMKPKEISAFRRERLGFIFQDCNLLDTLTAFENIALALTILKRPAGEIDRLVEETATLLGIEKLLGKFPYQLSGGEQQRVAAARAIITQPDLILADEPTGALDSKSARQLLERLEQLNRERQASILMVTHDPFTASYCHRILFIRDGGVYRELAQEGDSRRDFFARIMSVVSELGGEDSVM